MMRFILIGPAMITAIFALSACGQPDAPGGNAAMNAAANAMPGNDANDTNYVAAIDNLNEVSREGVFFRAIRDAGLQCRDVSSVEKIDAIEGLPAWRAHCDQGADHIIQVKPDGNATVLSPRTP